MITIKKDKSGFLIESFPYNPQFVQKIKTIAGQRWYPEGKYWSFPDTDGTLKKILKVFEGEEIHIDSALQSRLSHSINAAPISISTGKSHYTRCIMPNNFEELRRELVLRKYSYKTVKSYIYFNRDFLRFSGKTPTNINDEDVKNYLLYLVEEKQFATSTINQAINALKFYYGTMLKKKFIYEVKRPHKDKKYLLY